MSNQIKRTVSISLSLIASIILLLCVILPVFSFWNYRLYMITLLPVCLIAFLSCLKENNRARNKIGGFCIIVLSGIVAYISGFSSSALICAVISVLITLVLIMQEKLAFLNNRVGSIVFVCIVSGISIPVQINTILGFYNSYNATLSGTYDNIPDHVAGLMLTTAFNEIGMLITITCLLFSLIAVCVKISGSAEQSKRITVSEGENYAVDPSFVQTEIPFFDQEKQKETQTEETRVYSPLDPPEKHKKRYAPLWLTICLSVICVALAVVVFTLSGQISEKNTEIKTLTTMIDKLEDAYLRSLLK